MLRFTLMCVGFAGVAALLGFTGWGGDWAWFARAMTFAFGLLGLAGVVYVLLAGAPLHQPPRRQ